jgi:hypothetical protein
MKENLFFPILKALTLDLSFVACLFHHMKKTEQATTYHMNGVLMKIMRVEPEVVELIHLSVCGLKQVESILVLESDAVHS